MKADLGEGLRSRAPATVRRLSRLTAAATASAMVVLADVTAAAADPVHVTPTSTGLDFAAKVQSLLDWGAQIALWACLASILAGAGAWGLSKHFGNYGGAHKGMQLVIGGAIGALIVASAGPIVNSMFGG
jgi:hypothetical protein